MRLKTTTIVGLALSFVLATGCDELIEDIRGEADADAQVGDVGSDVADVEDTSVDDGHDSSDLVDAADGAGFCDTAETRAHIDGVELSGAIFVGRPALPGGQYPPEPTVVRDFEEYSDHFSFDGDATGRADGSVDAGTFVASGENALAWSVSLFFVNGGEEATIVPTGSEVPLDADLARLDGLGGGLLVVPGLAGADEAARSDGFDRIRATLNADGHEDLFFVGSAPASASVADLSASPTPAYVDFRAASAALYVPWLTVASAADSSATVEVPPGGAVAGIYARTDAARGVWKAPAGTEAEIRGPQALAVDFDEEDTGAWNQNQINALRTIDGTPVVWGARTRQDGSPDWTYVSTRRLAMYIEQSIRAGTRWAAFEPNDEALWAKLESDVRAFLDGIWRAGGLQGATEDEAYFVRVDRTTTTEADIQEGRAVVLVGFAATAPAEFVVLRLGVGAGGCL